MAEELRYNLVESAEKLEGFLHHLLSDKVVACDTETTGLFPERGARICGVSMSGSYLHYYSPTRHTTGKNIPETFKLVDEFLNQFEGTIVYHNAKFDLKMFKVDGVDFPKRMDDTILMAHLILEDNWRAKLGLKTLCKTILGEEPEDQAMLLDHLKQFTTKESKESKKAMAHVAEGDPAIVGQYAQSDTRFTRALYVALRDKVKGLCEELYQLEVKLMQHLVYTELRGVLVDRKLLAKLRDEARIQLDATLTEIRKETGLPQFNPSSDLQMENLLFEILGLEKPTDATTATGRVSMAGEVLDRFDVPVVNKIRAYKKLLKLYGTYYVGMADFMTKGDTIHCQFNQVGAKTGRFSEEKPNLQNIPRGESVRQVFTVRPGYMSYRYDYNQVEYRIFAHYCRDKDLIKSYRENPQLDLHALVAEELGVPRDKGKTVNFATVYGAGVRRIAGELKTSMADAKVFLTKYYSRFPGVARLRDSATRAIRDRTRKRRGVVEELGWIKDMFGRRHYIELDRSYTAVNALIQGCAASLLKTAMVRVYEYLEEVRKSYGPDSIHLLNCIHDEIEIEIRLDVPIAEKIALKIQELMEDFPQFDVPILVDVKRTTENWAAAKEWDGQRKRSAPTAS